MFSKFKFPRHWNGRSADDSVQEETEAILKKAIWKLKRDARTRVHELKRFDDRYADPTAIHTAIENVTDCYGSIINYLDESSEPSDRALGLISGLAERSRKLMLSPELAESGEARLITMRSLNALFIAKQEIKQLLRVVTGTNEKSLTADTANELFPPPESPKFEKDDPIDLFLFASVFYQLHKSMFPSERMFVAAGKRSTNAIQVQAVFDVTGQASQVGVRADAIKLADALIDMYTTETYFAVWLHSHPGLGPAATHPSEIDTRQHADWLSDYSQNLVSAIMVRDGFIRFWGDAIDSGRVRISIEGAGITLDSRNEHIYKLDSIRGI